MTTEKHSGSTQEDTADASSNDSGIPLVPFSENADRSTLIELNPTEEDASDYTVNDYLIYAYIELGAKRRCYISQTLKSRAEQRDKEHRKGKSGAEKFNAFVKNEVVYGDKKFDDILAYQVLETFRGTAKECAEKENKYIQEWNAIENGWNLRQSAVRNKNMHIETPTENDSINEIDEVDLPKAGEKTENDPIKLLPSPITPYHPPTWIERMKWDSDFFEHEETWKKILIIIGVLIFSMCSGWLFGVKADGTVNWGIFIRGTIVMIVIQCTGLVIKEKYNYIDFLRGIGKILSFPSKIGYYTVICTVILCGIVAVIYLIIGLIFLLLKFITWSF